MAKFTVYISDDLKADMDAADRQEPKPNWSAVAQEAFRLECARQHNRKRSGKKMDAIVERLRASKERTINEQKAAGHLAGRAWATNHAQYEQLTRLAEWDSTNCDEEFAWYAFAVIVDDARPEASDCNDFWERYARTATPSDDYAEAFIDGACEVYNEVAEKL